MKVHQTSPYSKSAVWVLFKPGVFMLAFVLIALGFSAPAQAGALVESSGTVSGGEWVNVRAIPSVQGEPQGRIYEGGTVSIDCYVHGDPVEGAGRSSDIWYKIAGSGTEYVTSLYVATDADLSQCAVGPRLEGPETRAIYCGEVTCTVYWDKHATSQLSETMKAAVAGEHVSTIAVCGVAGFAVGGPVGAIGVPVLCETVAYFLFDRSEEVLRAAQNAHSARGCYETEMYQGDIIRHGHTTDGNWCG